MSDERTCMPKRMLYGQLPNAKRHPGGQRQRYKDQLRVNLKTCNSDYTKLEALAADRSQWRRLCYSVVEQLEHQRIDTAKTRRATRKAHIFTNSSTSTSYICVPVDTSARLGSDSSAIIDVIVEIRRVDDSVHCHCHYTTQ